MRRHWNRFHDSGRLLRINRVIDHFARRFHECHWNISLHQQVDRLDIALGIGGLKMKLHKACIAKLFERNDLVLDAESILEVARTL